ncbi:hypothetical protein [Nocardioides sp.]|uniref:DUF7507 domain-containing protein n=1 Tax=Nocardioides sp. TaxID=35761 RepID=UPI0037847B2A
MSRPAIATLDRGALKLVQNAVLVMVLAFALVTLVPLAGPAHAAGGNPPGNNGTVKVAELGDMDAPPDNDPHVGCTFTVEWYGFDQGADIISHVTFEPQAPTADVVLDVTGPSDVFVGGDPASGAGTATGLDGREVYTLSFHGDPHPVQGYHVKLTVNTPGSQGADKKSKVFWVKGCQAPPPAAPAIHLEKTVTDSADPDAVGSLGEVLTYGMTVTNTGNTVLTNVTITDPMLGLSGAPCVATLAVGASTTCPLLPPLTHVVTSADVAAGSVSNVAVATGTPPSGPPVSDADDATIPTVSGAPQPADLSLVKTADKTIVAPGDQVTYTLRALNAGPGVARDVVVTDVLPAGTSFVSASSGCSNSGGTVTCHLGDIAGGDDAVATITVRIDALPSSITGHDHQLDVTKIESHVSVAGGATGSATTACPAGYLATDGSVRLDHVDQGTGTFADAMVLRSEATANGLGWTGTVRNDTTGQLQAKVNVVCMSDHTVSGEDHSHPVVISDSLTTTRAFATGEHELDLACGPGTIAITPGFSFLSGDGVVTSQPIATGRHFKVRMLHDGQVTLTTRCLRTDLGTVRDHTHQLEVTQLSGHVVVGPHGIEERSLTCRDGAKGIVAWVDFDGQPLGNDPQPITRVFRFYNPTDAPMTADYGLTCIDVRTSGGNQGSRDIENTAHVTTTSQDAAAYDDVSTATISVTPTGVSASGSGVVQGGASPAVLVRVSADQRHTVRLSLVSTHRVAGTGVRPGTVLAGGVAHVRGTGQTVRLAATDAARAALRSGKVHTARLVLRSPDGARDTVTVRLH